MATKEQLYNSALAILGERPLSSVTEERAARYRLDDAYTADAVEYCLELVKPRFALRTENLSTTVSGTAGFSDSYQLPSDYVCIHGAFQDDAFEVPLSRYLIESDWIATDVTGGIWLRYVTDDVAEADFNPTFTKVLAAYLAKIVAPSVSPDKITYADQVFKERTESAVTLEREKEPRDLPKRSTFTLTQDWLRIYNGALLILGLDEINDIEDDSRRRTVLDTIVNDGAEEFVLDTIRPWFAAQIAKLDSPTTDPDHGYSAIHSLPADYVTIVGLFVDDDFDEPVSNYLIEGNSLLTKYDTVYLRYISDDQPSSSWTQGFRRALMAYLARQAAPRLLQVGQGEGAAAFRQSELDRVRAEMRERFEEVIALEGVKEPPVRPKTSTATLTQPWLRIYNHALSMLALEPILDTDDDSQRRFALDEARNSGAVDTVLDIIGWDFAYQSVKLTNDTSLDPEWGFQYVFHVPSDMGRIDQISANEYFSHPLHYYREEDYFYANVQELYLRYVSTSFLDSPDDWPIYFRNLVAAEMASRCTWLPRVDVRRADAMYRGYRSEAFSTDAQRNPPQRITEGSWTRSRQTFRRRHSGYLGRP